MNQNQNIACVQTKKKNVGGRVYCIYVGLQIVLPDLVVDAWRFGGITRFQGISRQSSQ